jgi:hypothetical protein
MHRQRPPHTPRRRILCSFSLGRWWRRLRLMSIFERDNGCTVMRNGHYIGHFHAPSARVELRFGSIAAFFTRIADSRPTWELLAPGSSMQGREPWNAGYAYQRGPHSLRDVNNASETWLTCARHILISLSIKCFHWAKVLCERLNLVSNVSD